MRQLCRARIVFCFEHWGRNDQGEGGYSGEGDTILDGFFGVLDASSSSFGLELHNSIALPSEAQLAIDAANAPLWQSHSLLNNFTSMNDFTTFIDFMIRSYNHDNRPESNNVSDTLDTGDNFQPFSSRSLATWSADDQLNDSADFQLQLPIVFVEKSSTTSPTESVPPPATSAETKRCNFEGCGCIYKDRKSLRNINVIM
jgi:hypothetical protein